MFPVAVLAGGLGTRLQQLTTTVPKALIDINGEPFIRETGGGVFIVPLTDRAEVLFTIEPAVTDGKPVLWLPAGAMKAGILNCRYVAWAWASDRATNSTYPPRVRSQTRTKTAHERG